MSATTRQATRVSARTPVAAVLGAAPTAMSEASGRHIEYPVLPLDAVRQWNEDLARMFEWFDGVGYDADIVGLR